MYIVTGGAGFIGSAMIWKLNEENIDDILEDIEQALQKA